MHGESLKAIAKQSILKFQREYSLLGPLRQQNYKSLPACMYVDRKLTQNKATTFDIIYKRKPVCILEYMLLQFF